MPLRKSGVADSDHGARHLLALLQPSSRGQVLPEPVQRDRRRPVVLAQRPAQGCDALPQRGLGGRHLPVGKQVDADHALTHPDVHMVVAEELAVDRQRVTLVPYSRSVVLLFRHHVREVVHHRRDARMLGPVVGAMDLECLQVPVLRHLVLAKAGVRRREVIERLRHVRVRRAVGGAIALEHLPMDRDCLAASAQVVEHVPQIPEPRGDRRMVLAENAPGMIHGRPKQRLRLIQPAVEPQGFGQRVERRADAWVILPEYSPAQIQPFAEQHLGLSVSGLAEAEPPQVVQCLPERLRVASRDRQLAPHGHRRVEQGVGPREFAALGLVEPLQGQRSHEIGMWGIEVRPPNLVGARQQGRRFRVLAPDVGQRPQIVQRRRLLEAVPGRVPPSRFRSLEERGRVVIVAEALVDAADHAHHRGLQDGIAREFAFHATRADRKQLARRHLASLRFARIRRLKEVLQEHGHLRCLLALGLCAVTLAGQPDAVECRDRRDEPHHRCGGHHRATMASDELAGTVAERVGSRLHGQPVEVSADVLRQLLDRSVAPLGFLAQGGESDHVEVARQAPAEPLRRRAARGGDGVG